ncbi:MAG: hypothetical protein K9G41_03790 [Flavobacteriales bacterium]|nr:hypothetical protein [Flavobacteriales bacterium]
MRIGIIIIALVGAALMGLSGIFDNEAMYGLIHADAQGYYGYLVAIFIEHSFNWEQVIHSYADVYFDGGGADFTVHSEIGSVNKYYVGTAVLMLPFFLLSCVAAVLFGFPVDGYSEPFHIGIMVGALFYIGVGMYFLSKYLENRGTDRTISLFVVVFLLFATGLFHYSISEPAMSHAYSFSLFCVFLFSVDAWFKTESRTSFITASIVFGLIVLVRPANGLVIFSVPFIAGGIVPLKDKLLSMDGIGKKLLLGVVVVFTVLSIQSLMYLAQVGKPLIWSYEGEGFNFLAPEVLNVLFSFKKGLFVYTPIAFLGTVGLIWMLLKRKTETIWLWLFLALSIYVISCWWNWYYGGSLGMRALIEYLPFFALGLAFLLQNSGQAMKAVVVTLCLFFVSINLVQSYQYQKFILHWDGMNQERFWTVFMKTDRKYDGIFYRQETVLQLPSEEEIQSRAVFESDLEEGTTWGNQGINTEKANSGRRSTLINAQSNYGSTLGVLVSEMGAIGERKLIITSMVWSSIAYPDLTIAYSYRNDSSDYGHEYVPLGHLITEEGQWLKVETIVPIKPAADTSDNWIVYPFTTGKADIYLDDIRYEVITLNPASEQP